MRQVIQRVRAREVAVADVPVPHAGARGVLVRTVASVISPGTERMLLEFAGKSLLGKARSRPDLVRQVMDKVRRDGFVETARVVMGRLERPLAPGYACAGTVIAAGSGAAEFAVGDAVACAGAGYASHAEVKAAAMDSGPVELAGAVARDRARVVAVGVIGLRLPRRGYYEKELSVVLRARAVRPQLRGAGEEPNVTTGHGSSSRLAVRARASLLMRWSLALLEPGSGLKGVAA